MPTLAGPASCLPCEPQLLLAACKPRHCIQHTQPPVPATPNLAAANVNPYPGVLLAAAAAPAAGGAAYNPTQAKYNLLCAPSHPAAAALAAASSSRSSSSRLCRRLHPSTLNISLHNLPVITGAPTV